MQITTHSYPHGIVVTLSGELDPQDCEVLPVALTLIELSTPRHIILDIREISSLDPAILRSLLLTASRFRENSLSLCLAEPSAPVKETLDSLKISEVIPTFATIDEAVGAYGT